MATPALGPLEVSSEQRTQLGDAGWQLTSTTGSASDFHLTTVSPGTQASIWLHQIPRTAAVLGSSQPATTLNHAIAEANGVEVCTRRSGGGLVVVEPDAALWVDVVLPQTHQLWVDDVGASFYWLGELWAKVLRDSGFGAVSVHEGRLLNRDQGRVLCFAGLGPGEVTVSGQKVVGLSQRRGRFGARFQCLVLLTWPGELTKLLLQPDAIPPDLDVVNLPAGLPYAIDRQQLLDRFLISVSELAVS